MSEIRKQLTDIASGYEYWQAIAKRFEEELHRLEGFLQEEYPDEFKKFFKTGIHSAVELAIKLLREGTLEEPPEEEERQNPGYGEIWKATEEKHND